MRSEESIHHMIDQYLEGKLVGEDLDIIRSKIKKDPEFANEVALHKALRDEIMDQRETELRALLSEKGEVAYIKSMWSGTWVRASAAIFIAFIGLYAFLKLYNPNQTENLAKTDSATLEQKANEQKTLPEETTQKGLAEVPLTDSSVAETAKDAPVPPPLVEQEEVDLAEKQDTELEKLRTIREEADALDADEDVVVQKDQMIAERTMLVYNVTEVQSVQADRVNTSTPTKETEGVILSETEAKKRKRIFRKKEGAETDSDKTEETQEEFESDDAPSANATRFVQSPGEEIKLQYWKNILDFQGYSYRNNTISVYGLDPTKSAVIKKYNGNTYLMHDKNIYLIKKSSRALPFQIVGQPEIIKALNQN
jgi:hypothetical protein